MGSLAKHTTATIIPCLRYRNAPVAIDWLCQTFGFERQLLVPGENGTIAHAQLTFGNGMIMVGSAAESEFGRLMKQPDETGGAETQCAYVIVTDADAIYAKAKSAGARIAIDIKDEDYGGAVLAATTRRGTFGTSAPTIHGDAPQTDCSLTPLHAISARDRDSNADRNLRDAIAGLSTACPMQLWIRFGTRVDRGPRAKRIRHKADATFDARSRRKRAGAIALQGAA